jgi:Leu/Phe-tRNA-protein transferase
MKTEVKLLELYAEAYKTRSAKVIKEYVPAVIQYIKPGKRPLLMAKNKFLEYLQEKFNGQRIQIPIEDECIMIVNNETTGKENIFIDFGGKQEYLFSINVENGKYARITISKPGQYRITDKKVILKKQNWNMMETKTATSESFIQRSNKFNYLKSGKILILEKDNPDEVIDVIINTNYPYEVCIGESFNLQYLMNLIKSGFYIMSGCFPQTGEYILKAMHHLSRSVLFFDHIHIKHSIKKYLARYELKVNVEFESIVDRCVEKHNDLWLTKPLVGAMKTIHEINDPDVTFASFGLYRDGVLVAGDFGTKVGRVYSSYSGFYEEDNAGTVQMILTAHYLVKNGYAFWDLGMPLNYKSALGAKVVNIEDFTAIWKKYSKQPNKAGLDYEKFPVPRHNMREEELLWVFRNAYRYFYTEDLENYLVDDFHYSSQYVFHEITSKSEYLGYLNRKLKTILNSAPPYNELLMEMVYDFHTNKPYLFMKQGRDEALFVAKTKDGKFLRLDLCMPGLYSFKA